MNISKQFLSEKLIEGYTVAPPSLKEQTLIKLAIGLCQFDLREYILWAQGTIMRRSGWEYILDKKLRATCMRLKLPHPLKMSLTVRIRPIVVQLFRWNIKHQKMLNDPTYVSDRHLTSSDWTVEGRIDERKAAESLVQDTGLALLQRYQIACVYCLESSIRTFWDKISPKLQEDLCSLLHPGLAGVSKLVKLWSCHMAGKFEELDIFWRCGFERSAQEGERSAVVYFWNLLSENRRNEVIIRSALGTFPNYRDIKTWYRKMSHGDRWLAPPTHYSDILYYLFSQMSDEQRIEFFRYTTIDVLAYNCFLQSPNEDYFMSVINKMWDILPKGFYGEILYFLAERYVNFAHEIEYQEYDYGGLLLNILEETPDVFKRYIFTDKPNRSRIKNAVQKLLLIFFKKNRFECRHIILIQKILKHGTGDEKQSFIYSYCGEELCKFLIVNRQTETLDTILADCLPKEAIVHFKKSFQELNNRTYTLK